MDDLIKRQDAVNELSYCQTYLFDSRDNDKKISLEDAEYTIERLPSAQQWIPCSERLPDKEGEYLVTFSDEWKRNLVRVLWYGTPFDLDDRTMWTFYCEHEYGFEAFKAEKPIVAWMPLPEPYKEGEK